MKNYKKTDPFNRVKSHSKNGFQILQGFDKTESKSKRVNMTIEPLQNVDISKIEHNIILESDLGRATSKCKNINNLSEKPVGLLTQLVAANEWIS